MRAMQKSTTGFVLLGLALLSGAPGYAQNPTACELLTKADVECVLGVTLPPPRSDAPFRSLLDNQDFVTGSPGEICVYSTFSLEVRYSSTPNPRAVDDARRQVAARTRDAITEVTDLGDAAFRTGPPSWTTLFVFRGGTMRMVIGPSEIEFEKEKALAVKAPRARQDRLRVPECAIRPARWFSERSSNR